MGLEIFDIENLKTHGGSNRYYIKKRKTLILKFHLEYIIIQLKN